MAKIMVVDDQPDVRIILRKRLTAAGYEVVEYPDALSAIKALADEDPDLILLDVNMPGIDGMEACRRITEDFPKIPVVFLTARGDVEDRVMGFDAGGRDYIPKPFSSAEVLARVKATIREKEIREKAEQKANNMEKKAITDGLTGVFNRGYFDGRLDEEVARAYRYGFDIACMMLDIDNFKSINDTYGHAVGDEVLVAVAGAIRRGLRSVDIISRYGGEEFSVIMPETDLNEARSIAERVRVQIESLDLGKGKPKVTASIGVASGASNDLVLRSDQALYDAKRRGKNRVCFTS